MPCVVAVLQPAEFHLARARVYQSGLEELVLAVVSEDAKDGDGPLLARHGCVQQVQLAPDLLLWSAVIAARAGFPKDGDFDFHDCINIQLYQSLRKS